MASKIRDRIVAAALKRFSAKGFAGTSTKEIAAAADVNETSLFRLFDGKEALFSAAMILAIDQGPDLDHMARILKDEPNFRKAITTWAHVLYDRLTPELQRITYYSFLETPGGRIEPEVLEWPVKVVTTLMERIKAEQKKGVVRRGIRADVVAFGLIMFVYYHFMNANAYSAPDNIVHLDMQKADLSELLKLWIRGVSPDSKSK